MYGSHTLNCQEQEREEYSYEKRPKINGTDDVIKAAKSMIADANKEFFVILYLNIIRQKVYRTIYMLMNIYIY
jgi:hypothetical protein